VRGSGYREGTGRRPCSPRCVLNLPPRRYPAFAAAGGPVVRTAYALAQEFVQAATGSRSGTAAGGDAAAAGGDCAFYARPAFPAGRAARPPPGRSRPPNREEAAAGAVTDGKGVAMRPECGAPTTAPGKRVKNFKHPARPSGRKGTSGSPEVTCVFDVIPSPHPGAVMASHTAAAAAGKKETSPRRRASAPLPAWTCGDRPPRSAGLR